MANYNSLKNAALIAPTTTPDLGSATNRYGNVFLSGNVDIGGTSLTSANAITPRISSITYVGDDTAASVVGGETIIIVGSGFNYGASVYIGGTIVSVVSVVSSTQITFTSPAKSAGNYALVIVNPDGASATFVPGIQYSGVPAWSTAAGSLGAFDGSSSFSASLSATSDSAVTYSIASGTLPSGITLNSSTGSLSGTLPTVTVSTTYNFTVRATDSENQSTDRNFSINVTAVAAPGQQAYTTPGTYSWTAPAGVTRVSVVAVGAGGGGIGGTSGGTGGAAGGLGWKNNITVVPGQSYTVVVGEGGANRNDATSAGQTATAGGASHFINTSTVRGGGGGAGIYNNGSAKASGGTFTGDGGGNGGSSGSVSGGGGAGGAGGAGGYAGNGGDGGNGNNSQYTVAGQGRGYDGIGGGGGGSGGSRPNFAGRAGGGVGLLGQGANGVGGNGGFVNQSPEYGGGGGSDGTNGGFGAGTRGGGGTGGATNGGSSGYGGDGGVRIIWGSGRAFPATNTADQ